MKQSYFRLKPANCSAQVRGQQHHQLGMMPFSVYLLNWFASSAERNGFVEPLSWLTVNLQSVQNTKDCKLHQTSVHIASDLQHCIPFSPRSLWAERLSSDSCPTPGSFKAGALALYYDLGQWNSQLLIWQQLNCLESKLDALVQHCGQTQAQWTRCRRHRIQATNSKQTTMHSRKIVVWQTSRWALGNDNKV